MVFDEKKAGMLLKQGYRPVKNKARNAIYLRKGSSTKAVGLKNTPEDWGRIARLRTFLSVEEPLTVPLERTQPIIAWSNTALFRDVKELIGRNPHVEEMLIWLLGFNRGQRLSEEKIAQHLKEVVNSIPWPK